MKPLSNDLKWGLLSTAKINSMLIPSLKHAGKDKLLAVASRSLKSASDYASRWNIPRAHGSYEALLADQDIDFIYIGLPNHLHAEWVIKAVQAGKHVLCEKPLALTTDDVDLIMKESQKSGKIVTEAFMYRHHTQTKKVQNLIESGTIGKVGFIRGSFSFFLDAPNNIRWNKEYGGGSLWDIGCYPISYFRMLAGCAPDDVIGWQMLAASGVDESFYGQLHFPNGMTGQFDSSFRLPPNTSIEIRGEEGTLIVSSPFRILEKSSVIIRNGNKERTIRFSKEDLYLGEIEDIEKAVFDGTAPLIRLSESRDNIATIQALYQSAASI